jgi:hypothetical protein
VIPIDGRITDYNERGEITIRARYENVGRFIECGYKEAIILLKDSRTVTAEQRKKIYAMLNEIADYMGEFPDIVKKQFKWELRYKRYKGMLDDFSLSNCSIETASAYIDLLVETIIAWGIPLKQPLIELCEDIPRYVYTCLKYKKCAICGRSAELHHVDVVGIGRDRTEIAHEGMRALPLCRKHHGECHTMGSDAFAERYRLEPVRLDKELCKIYKVKNKKGDRL